MFKSKNKFVIEMVRGGPNGPNMVPKKLTISLTIWDPFRSLWKADKPAIFGCFWSEKNSFLGRRQPFNDFGGRILSHCVISHV